MKKSQIAQKLKNFKGTRLLVIGDLMLDRFIRGDVARLSPEAPVPIVEVREEELMPGGAGNVASNIVSLGGSVDLVSVVGGDDDASRLFQCLNDRGVGIDGVFSDTARPTIVKTRVLADHQQVVRYDREDRRPLNPKAYKHLLRRIQKSMPDVRGVVISDYGKGVITRPLLKNVLRLAHHAGKFVFVDPKVEHFLRYRGVDCITPNLKEAAEGIRMLTPRSDKEIDQIGWRILRRLRCRAVLITRGDKGMSLYQSPNKVFHAPSQSQEVFDVTGAGDTVIAAFSLARASGRSLNEAAHLSNLAAGAAVAKLGTTCVTFDDIRQFLSRSRS